MIMSKHRFLTIEETKEILYYECGVYVEGGEILIEKSAEKMFGYKLANRHLTEIKGHIMRTSYHKQAELDSDVEIINLKNGLYNIDTGTFRDHTPDYLSITQKPVKYNRAAKTEAIWKISSTGIVSNRNKNSDRVHGIYTLQGQSF